MAAVQARVSASGRLSLPAAFRSAVGLAQGGEVVLEATGRKKLVISGLATEVCAAFPAIAALQDGDETYVVIDACADFNPLITQVTMQRLAAAGVIVTTWVAVLAELAANTQQNGVHIGRLLSDHVGQYYAAMNSFLGVASNAEQVKTGLGLTGHTPIPAVGV